MNFYHYKLDEKKFEVKLNLKTKINYKGNRLIKS